MTDIKWLLSIITLINALFIICTLKDESNARIAKMIFVVLVIIIIRTLLYIYLLQEWDANGLTEAVGASTDLLWDFKEISDDLGFAGGLSVLSYKRFNNIK